MRNDSLVEVTAIADDVLLVVPPLDSARQSPDTK
jgi:hypothetical protein